MGSGIESIKLGAELIKQGEVVAFPTETVYGLGADAFSSCAINKIYEAKGRPNDNPLIIHLYDISDLDKVAVDIPEIAFTLYNMFCPGPLTMILKKAPNVPYSVTGGLDTVGVRFPSHEVARELIRLSMPIAAPSANISKHISPTTAQHVFEDLQGRIPLILDGGSCNVGIESTIVDLSGDKPLILRPGAITKEMLLKVANFEEYKNNNKALAPGMKYTHYSPCCDCVVGDTIKDIKSIYDKNVKEGKSVIILAKDSTILSLGSRKAWSLGKNGNEAANRFYSLLREGEHQFALIIVENLGDEGVFYSIMNRAFKAAKKA